jgi:hypothetical protein
MIKTPKSLIFFIVIFLACSFSVFAQTDSTAIQMDSTTGNPEQVITSTKSVLTGNGIFIINRWEISEYKENGKIQELPNYEIEFFDDGTYTAIEEEEFDNGKWSLSEDNSLIIFDINTISQEEWIIESIDSVKIVVKLSDEGNMYEYTFVPWVKRIQQ